MVHNGAECRGHNDGNRLDARLEALCKKGCRRVWQDIAVLEKGGELVETRGLDSGERAILLRELKQIMAVYSTRCAPE